MADKDLKYRLTLQDLFSKKMQGAVDSTKRMDGAMSGLGGKIAGVAASIGIGAFAKEMVTTGAKFDSYKARLETMLGSQQKASDAFNQIKIDAAKTPFDVGSLVEANSMLISAGSSAEDARHTVMGLGNAIAATGGGSDELSRMAVNLQQIKTLGKASAMDIKQFAFAGIPIYQMLAKTTGKTVEQVREMDVTYEQLQSSFDKAAEKGGMFYNGLAKQSATVGGQISNLGDQFTNTMVMMYDRLKPLISQIIGLLSKMLSWVARNQETIIFFGKLIGVIGGAVLAYKAWAAVTSLTTVAQLGLNAAMSANPLGLVIAAVVALTGAIAALESRFNSLIGSIKQNRESGYKDEVNKVAQLAASYKGLNKEQALGQAITAERSRLTSELALAQKELENSSLGNIEKASNKVQSIKGALGALSDPNMLGSILSKKDELAKATSIGAASLATKGSSAGASSAKSSLGSSTEVSSARPQSLVININDGLVKTMNIYATTIKESATKIRDEVTKALLETANDTNLAAR